MGISSGTEQIKTRRRLADKGLEPRNTVARVPPSRVHSCVCETGACQATLSTAHEGMEGTNTTCAQYFRIHTCKTQHVLAVVCHGHIFAYRAGVDAEMSGRQRCRTQQHSCARSSVSGIELRVPGGRVSSKVTGSTRTQNDGKKSA